MAGLTGDWFADCPWAVTRPETHNKINRMVSVVKSDARVVGEVENICF